MAGRLSGQLDGFSGLGSPGQQGSLNSTPGRQSLRVGDRSLAVRSDAYTTPGRRSSNTGSATTTTGKTIWDDDQSDLSSMVSRLDLVLSGSSGVGGSPFRSPSARSVGSSAAVMGADSSFSPRFSDEPLSAIRPVARPEWILDAEFPEMRVAESSSFQTYRTATQVSGGAERSLDFADLESDATEVESKVARLISVAKERKEGQRQKKNVSFEGDTATSPAYPRDIRVQMERIRTLAAGLSGRQSRMTVKPRDAAQVGDSTFSDLSHSMSLPSASKVDPTGGRRKYMPMSPDTDEKLLDETSSVEDSPPVVQARARFGFRTPPTKVRERDELAAPVRESIHPVPPLNFDLQGNLRTWFGTEGAPAQNSVAEERKFFAPRRPMDAPKGSFPRLRGAYTATTSEGTLIRRPTPRASVYAMPTPRDAVRSSSPIISPDREGAPHSQAGVPVISEPTRRRFAITNRDTGETGEGFSPSKKTVAEVLMAHNATRRGTAREVRYTLSNGTEIVLDRMKTFDELRRNFAHLLPSGDSDNPVQIPVKFS